MLDRLIQPAHLDEHGAPVDVRATLDRILRAALDRRASDVHFDPTSEGCEIKFRIDGLLEHLAAHPSDVGKMLVTRLMVMAKLLTYRPDVPQEGRATFEGHELRVSIMPTAHGPRAAVRLPAELLEPQSLDQLGLPREVFDGLDRFARADSGMLIVTGPAGSGKTTTIYALLRHIAQLSEGRISVVTLEDPVERDLSRDGIVQIEVAPFGQLGYERALRSILRQDPQVLMLGEIRDASTASLAVQATLSGHRLICTLHASTPAGAIVRLLEMGIEPYQLTSSLFAVMTQRLVRRLATASERSGYHGRIPIAELVPMNTSLRGSILAREDVETLSRSYESEPTHRTLRASADHLLAQNITDEAEILRVLGAT